MTQTRSYALSRVPAVAAGILALAAWWGQNLPALGAEAVPPPPAPDTALAADPNVEVMTRGPVHEAYAMPVTSGRTAGLTVPKGPPEPIEEAPPEVKPADENATWISGYWSWDDDRKDYIWVSGVWRVSPPGYRWVPGYWQNAVGSWQWVSGFWMTNAAQEIEYLPQPPESLEQGPTSAAPSTDYFWVPGHWRWRGLRYVWSPGYWAASRPEWVWVSPSYYWSPRGWVYCTGYWDYPLTRRGLLFVPVYFARPVAYYRPAVCVDFGPLTFSLFCRPAYCHYYFGDYYASSYVDLGIRPWFDFYGPRYGYDPLFCYYRSYYQQHGHPDWEHNLRGWHDYYRDHPDMRLPHTLAEQQKLLADPAARKRADIGQIAISQPVANLKTGANAFVKVQPVTANQQIAIQQTAKEAAKFKSERHNLETLPLGGSGKPIGAAVTGPKQPEKVDLSKLPGFQATRRVGVAETHGPTGTGVPSGQAIQTPPVLRGPSEKRVIESGKSSPTIVPGKPPSEKRVIEPGKSLPTIVPDKPPSDKRVIESGKALRENPPDPQPRGRDSSSTRSRSDNKNADQDRDKK